MTRGTNLLADSFGMTRETTERSEVNPNTSFIRKGGGGVLSYEGVLNV